MRAAIPATLVLLLALPLGQSMAASVEGGELLGGEVGPHVPVSADLAVFPAPDAWVGDDLAPLSILILNATFTPDLSLSSVSLDGSPLIPEWNASARAVRGLPRGAHDDGPHAAEAVLRDTLGATLEASWSFSVDSIIPIVDLDPLPEVADVRIVDISGTAQDSNLVRVEVNGYTATLDGSRFTVPVLLWPGRTDLAAEAYDLASNVGLAETSIRWDPVATSETYSEHSHPNSSFSVRFPDSWEVSTDENLGGGVIADFQAINASQLSSRSSVGIVSRPVGSTMSEALLLTVMSEALLDFDAANVELIARPRVVPSASATAAAEFSLVETLPGNERVFRHATGFWDRPQGRLWLLLASIRTDRVESDWHAAREAIASFTPFEVDAPGPEGGGERGAIGVATYVTVAAIVFVVVLFLSILVLRRREARRASPSPRRYDRGDGS